jgi:hypothetical protein
MEPSLTAVLLVDPDFRALSRRFLVETAPPDLIYHLKKKVAAMWHGDASFSHYDFKNIAKFLVWKPKGEMVIKKFTPQRTASILARINVEDEDTIEFLDEEDKVADFGPLEGQTLIVQLPGTSLIPPIVCCILIQVKVNDSLTDDIPEDSQVGDPITRNVDPDYKHCFLKAYEKRFTERDVALNNISDAPEGEVLTFVEDYEKRLDQKRQVAPNVRCFCDLSFRLLTNAVRCAK